MAASPAAARAPHWTRGQARARRGALRRRQAAGLLCLVPFILVNILVILGPSVATIYYGFTDWNGVGSANFIGMENFWRLSGDAKFHAALIHVVIWTLFFISVPIVMALMGAFLLSQVKRFQMFFRIVFFIPYTIASVVNAAIWKNIYDSNRGIVPLLADLGITPLEGIALLGNQRLALPAVAWVDTWHWWGFLVVVFLAAMQAVDVDLYDAVKIDGGGKWRQFRDVTLPGIRPTLVFVLLITLVGSLLVFDYIYIMTQGGPAGATEVVGTLLYEHAFRLFEAGYAAAMGLSMTFLSAIIMGIYVILRRRGWDI